MGLGFRVWGLKCKDPFLHRRPPVCRLTLRQGSRPQSRQLPSRKLSDSQPEGRHPPRKQKRQSQKRHRSKASYTSVSARLRYDSACLTCPRPTLPVGQLHHYRRPRDQRRTRSHLHFQTPPIPNPEQFCQLQGLGFRV